MEPQKDGRGGRATATSRDENTTATNVGEPNENRTGTTDSVLILNEHALTKVVINPKTPPGPTNRSEGSQMLVNRGEANNEGTVRSTEPTTDVASDGGATHFLTRLFHRFDKDATESIDFDEFVELAAVFSKFRNSRFFQNSRFQLEFLVECRKFPHSKIKFAYQMCKNPTF